MITALLNIHFNWKLLQALTLSTDVFHSLIMQSADFNFGRISTPVKPQRVCLKEKAATITTEWLEPRGKQQRTAFQPIRR